MDWIWLLSVWRTGTSGRRVSQENGQWRQEFQETLPDLTDADIGGSGFAITGYEVHPALGGDAALARLRKRMRKHGLRLMLDFVPNHMGLDHPWVTEHPDYFVAGTEALVKREPHNYIRVDRDAGDLILALGRDPNFPGWPDTLQLDYSNPAAQEAMMRELEKIAGQCDGVRCDMAMLILPDVFERTWGSRASPFWPAAILRVRDRMPDFCFMAEVYWQLEYTLQQQGFDYTYDKRLYDRLREGHARPVREHLRAAPDYQNKLARFLENHDEPRASSTFERGVHRAAAVITYSIPGLRFFHQGQIEGRQKRISPHLIRAPEESRERETEAFYESLFAFLRKPIMKSGDWQRHECRPAWDGNGSWNAFVSHSWRGSRGERILVVVNFAPHSSQCYLNLPFSEMENRSVRLKDSLSSACYDRDGNELLVRGLYLDMQPWAYHVFDIELAAVKTKTLQIEKEKAT
jgi:glycosidase